MTPTHARDETRRMRRKIQMLEADVVKLRLSALNFSLELLETLGLSTSPRDGMRAEVLAEIKRLKAVKGE